MGGQPNNEDAKWFIIHFAIPQEVLHILCVFLQVNDCIVHDDDLIVDKLTTLDCHQQKIYEAL